jgi:6-phosphogluconolactonase
MENQFTGQLTVYVGAYTRHAPEPRGEAEGISVCRLDPSSGELTLVSVAAGVVNPSFLALHPDGGTLYAVNETTETDGQPGGAVSSFRVDRATGGLTLLNQQPSHGADPCHVSVDATGRAALVANYTSGSVAAYPIEADGRLAPASSVHQHAGSSVDPERQAGPHAHFIAPDPSNQFALVADLGLDQVIVYRLDPERGSLSPGARPAELPPGSGPRHLAFHPTLPVVYVINELASTIARCDWDASAGRLTVSQIVSTLPDEFSGSNSCAEIVVARTGRFVYGSNRGHDSVACFAVDERDGRLAPIGHVASGGRSPRNIALDPSGRLLLAANQRSDTIAVFRVNLENGVPSPTGMMFQTPSPVCALSVV